jgi:hypothetical protein
MEGKAAARIGDEQGTSALDFYAVRELPWSFGGTTSDGAANIAFFDAQQKIRLMAGLGANGGPSLSLVDPQQTPRAVLSLNDQLDPSLTMFNAEKLPRAVISTDGADAGGSGHLIMYGAGGGLDLSAYDGHVRWTSREGAPLDAMPIKK